MKTKWLLTIPIIFSFMFLGLLGIGGYLLYQTGIKRDEYQWAKPPFAASTGIWIALVLVVIMLVISLGAICVIREMKKKQIALYVIIGIVVIIYSMFSYISNYQFYDTSSRIKTISLSALNQIQEKEETGLVYIGRDDCRYCNIVYPKLQILTATQKKEIKYYNTNEDRETNKMELDKVLCKYGVTRIPIVLSVENGIVTHSFLYDEINNHFQQYVLNA